MLGLSDEELSLSKLLFVLVSPHCPFLLEEGK